MTLRFQYFFYLPCEIRKRNEEKKENDTVLYLKQKSNMRKTDFEPLKGALSIQTQKTRDGGKKKKHCEGGIAK